MSVLRLRSSLSALTLNSRSGLLSAALRDSPARVLSCNLYGEARLKLDQFRGIQAKVSTDFGSIRDQFMSRVKQNLESDSKIIFTEDVKNVIYLATKSDVDLIAPLITKWVKQSENDFSTTSYKIGPLIARLLHVHREADLIYMLMTDPKLAPAFANLASFVIACDLLIEENRPQEALTLMEKFMEISDRKYPSDLTLLYAQACYKIGTEEALEKLTNYVVALGALIKTIPARVLSFLALLAMKHGKEAQAYEFTSSVRDASVVGLNAKVALQTKLGLLEDAIAKITSFTDPRRDRPFLSQEVYDALSSAINSSGSDELKNKFTSLNDLLVSRNLLDSRTFDEMANASINIVRDRNSDYRRDDRRSEDDSRPLNRTLRGQYDRDDRRQSDRPPGRYDDRDRRYDSRSYDTGYDNRDRRQYDGGYQRQPRQFNRRREDDYDQYSRDYQ